MINAAQRAPCAAASSLGSVAGSTGPCSSPRPWPLDTTDFPFISFIIFIFGVCCYNRKKERVYKGYIRL